MLGRHQLTTQQTTLKVVNDGGFEATVGWDSKPQKVRNHIVGNASLQEGYPKLTMTPFYPSRSVFQEGRPSVVFQYLLQKFQRNKH